MLVLFLLLPACQLMARAGCRVVGYMDVLLSFSV